MDSIFDYKMLSDSRKVKWFICFILMLLASFTIYVHCSYYVNYSNVSGVVTTEGDNYYIKVYILKDKINVFLKLKDIYIDEVKTVFSIIRVEEEMVIGEDGNYIEVVLLAPLDKNQLIANNILKIKYISTKEKMINKIKNMIGG